jgi:hypothetical protein
MNVSDFAHLPNFSPAEAWGDVKKVQWYHVIHLQQVREELRGYAHDWPMEIHCSYATSGHSDNSYHYKGLATDFHFVSHETIAYQYEILELALESLNLSHFVGIGIYPKWNNPGFHFDSRGFRARWIAKEGKYIYEMAKIEEILKEYQ